MKIMTVGEERRFYKGYVNHNSIKRPARTFCYKCLTTRAALISIYFNALGPALLHPHMIVEGFHLIVFYA